MTERLRVREIDDDVGQRVVRMPVEAGGVPGGRGVVDDISHAGLRMLVREEGVTFQRIKTWKASSDSYCFTR